MGKKPIFAPLPVGRESAFSIYLWPLFPLFSILSAFPILRPRATVFTSPRPDLTSRRPRSDVPTRSLSRVPRLFVNIMACVHMYPMQGTNHSTFCRSGTSRGKWLLFHRKLDKDTDLCVFMCFFYRKVKCFSKNGSLKSLLEWRIERMLCVYCASVACSTTLTFYSTTLNFSVLPLIEIDHVSQYCLS